MDAACCRTNSTMRTGKSCGPGAPRLALSWRRRVRVFADDGDNKAWSPGRSRISRNTIAQGRPVVRLVPVVLPRAFLLHADHGCGGHPAFPAPSVFDEGDLMEKLGCFIPREREHASSFFAWSILLQADAKHRPETVATHAPRDEVLASGTIPDPHGEEARSAVSNHEAGMQPKCAYTVSTTVIARSNATKQSRLSPHGKTGLLRCARNDNLRDVFDPTSPAPAAPRPAAIPRPHRARPVARPASPRASAPRSRRPDASERGRSAPG